MLTKRRDSLDASKHQSLGQFLAQCRRSEDARWPLHAIEKVHSPESAQPSLPDLSAGAVDSQISVNEWGNQDPSTSDSLNLDLNFDGPYWEDGTTVMDHFPVSLDHLIAQQLQQDGFPR